MCRNCAVVIIFSLLLKTGVAGTEVSDVIASPEKYNQRHLDLVGIARVPGEFYLFADAKAASRINKDVSKALYVRQRTPGQPDYSDLDRQWVRVSGVINAEARGRGESPAEMTLEKVERLQDRPPPRIKDSDIWGVFHNDTAAELKVETQGGSFWVGPGGSNEIVIRQGRVDVFTLKPKPGAAPYERDKDKQLTAGQINFSTIKK